MKKFLKNTALITLALLIVSITCSRSNTAIAQSDAVLYDMVWKIVNSKYLDQTNNGQDWDKWRHKYDDKIKTPEDAYVAIDTMIASLNDRYTRFVTPREFEDEKNAIKGSLFGIGIQMGLRDGKILVIAPLEDTPGERAGLLAEDEILAIDGVSTKDMSIDKAADKIRGKKGTAVELLIRRKNVPDKTYKIVRDEIEIKSISEKLPDDFKLDDKIAYIRLSSFMGRNVGNEFEDLMVKYKDKEGIIIDLRANTGGLLTNAIQISDLFLNNEIIVSTVDRDGYKDTSRSSKRYFSTQPLVVLINKGSASASEIMSGALKDNQRAILVGENTFGKGLVQEVKSLSPFGAGLNITVQKYLTPSGNDINKKGIAPDIEVKITDKDIEDKNDVQLKKAQEVLLQMIQNERMSANR
ncbi:MAG: S41 family peptidase [Candidatus Gastranaerophilales bacterium]|nr:S41 family peptidase [Candidatus Gastranaerophilales bacterium]